jgi:hypothetical protein
MADDRKVAGFCPACGHGTLFLAEEGHVTCSFADCLNPTGADELLEGGDKFHAALKQINVIRNSIIGRQTMNMSLHVYPLVQALGEAGFDGMDYDDAREKFGVKKGSNSGYEAERVALEAEGLFCGSLGSKPREGS